MFFSEVDDTDGNRRDMENPQIITVRSSCTANESLEDPVIIGPMSGVTSYDDIPHIHGTAEHPASRVEVFLDGLLLGTATVDRIIDEDVNLSK